MSCRHHAVARAGPAAEAIRPAGELADGHRG